MICVSVLSSFYLKRIGMCIVITFIKFGKFSGQYFIKYSPCPFPSPVLWDSLYVYWFTSWCFTGHSSSLHFSSFLFSICTSESDNCNWLFFKDVYSFFYQHKSSLEPSNKFYTFNSTIYIWSFLQYFFTYILFDETSPSYF